MSTATPAYGKPPARPRSDPSERPLFDGAEPMLRRPKALPGWIPSKASVLILLLGGAALTATWKAPEIITATLAPDPVNRLAEKVCRGDVTGWRCSCAVASILGASEAGPGHAWWDVRSECRRAGVQEGWLKEDDGKGR